MERRRSLKRKKEVDMTEQEETRMPSVRARIAVFDSHSRDGGRNSDEGKDKENQTVTEKRKRFTYPGYTRGSQDQQQQHLIFPSGQRTRLPRGTTDFEAHLQEVWSVRKNIHHKQQQQQLSPRATNTGSKTSILGTVAGGGGIVLTQADKYSRHGAIPSDHPQRYRDNITSDHTTSVETVTPWSVRNPCNFSSYTRCPDPTTVANTRPSHPHALEMTSSPSRRGRGKPIGICREDFEPAITPKKDDSDKVNYAKTMAKGYLQSVGSGEYTPQTHGHSKHTDTSTATDTQPVTNWKRTDSEEFDF